MNVSDELDDAIDDFLQNADSVYGEYEQGYVDADAALSMMRSHVETLREVAQKHDSAEE